MILTLIPRGRLQLIIDRLSRKAQKATIPADAGSDTMARSLDNQAARYRQALELDDRIRKDAEYVFSNVSTEYPILTAIDGLRVLAGLACIAGAFLVMVGLYCALGGGL